MLFMRLPRVRQVAWNPITLPRPQVHACLISGTGLPSVLVLDDRSWHLLAHWDVFTLRHEAKNNAGISRQRLPVPVSLSWSPGDRNLALHCQDCILLLEFAQS